jgi:dihydroxy-acid dehydratase
MTPKPLTWFWRRPMPSTPKTGLARGLTHYGDPDFALYLRRSFARSMGYGDDLLARPVIGITDTASGFNNCHRNVPELIEAVKRGVLAAGGLPLAFPVISLGEPFLHPTSLMFRNLMSMDTEEMIRAQPMDAVVLVGGCDKTVPALLMGALSADKPAILVVTGPMMTSRHGDQRLGACTDCRRFWAQYRAGAIDADEISAIETRLATTAGTCMVMGTASTMACIAETLGMMLPGTATIPAVHADRLRAAETSGARAVAMARAGEPRPSAIVSPAAVDNALRVLLALGGSTNGILHLAAIAGRAGIEVDLRRFNALSDATPVLVDLKPTGPHYMEDLFNAAGWVRCCANSSRCSISTPETSPARVWRSAWTPSPPTSTGAWFARSRRPSALPAAWSPCLARWHPRARS